MNRLAGLLSRSVVASLTAALLVISSTPWQRPRAMTVLVPAYIYPSGAGAEAWDRLCKAARSLSVQVVINPASGPGITADPNYVEVIKNLRDSGGKVLGYVHTSYGDRAIGLVLADITCYLDNYPVDGFFIDEMSTSPKQVSYYSGLYGFIKGQNPALEVVGNPGTNSNEAYMKSRTADRLVIFEGPATHFEEYLPAPWVRHYHSERFAHVIYGTGTAEEMLRVLTRTSGLHASAVFIGDGAGNNPYDRLPEYWEDEVAALRSVRP